LGWSGWRTRISVWPLCRRIWALGYHQIRGIFWLAENLLTLWRRFLLHVGDYI
jgi:hypothetical protein